MRRTRVTVTYEDKGGICAAIVTNKTWLFPNGGYFKRLGRRYCVVNKIAPKRIMACCEDAATLKMFLEWLEKA